MIPFWRVETQKADVKSDSVGGEEGEADPKEPWRGRREVGARRRFSCCGWDAAVSASSEVVWRGIPSLMARWVRGFLEAGEMLERMAIQRGVVWDGEREVRRVGQGAAVKLPEGRRTSGS